MNRLLVLGLVAALWAPALALAQGAGSPAPRIFPYETHVEKLDNGLEVVVIPMPSEGLATYWTIVRAGSRNEYEPGHTGFAHFFEHMMFRGTERFPANVYNEMMTRLGADTNAFTSDDLTAYHVSFTAADLEKVMDLESDRFRNLSYPEPAFRTEAGAVYGEYRKNRSNPWFLLHEEIQQTAFDVHTYGHTAMGYEADIERMPEMYAYSKRFFARYYRPDNVVLLIVGDVDVPGTMALVKKYYGDWKPGYVPPEIRPEPAQTAERRIDVPYDGRALPIVELAYKIDAFDPADRGRVAADLLAELAFGETSELYNKLVLDEQSVQLLGAGADVQRDPGLFEIVAQVKDPANVDRVLAEIDATIARYRETPPDPARLEDMKSHLKYAFLMRLTTPDRVASGLTRIVSATGGIDAVDALYRAYAAVTPEDVTAAASKYLVDARRAVAVLRGAQ